MAVIITSTPDDLTPGYDQVFFTFSSSTFTNDGYRYIVDIYNDETSELIASQRIAPQQDGTGEVDISRILNNFLDVDFDPLLVTSPLYVPIDAINSYLNYSIHLGEEYTVAWPYSGVTSFTNSLYSGMTRLNGATAHTYLSGNQLSITSSVAAINGLHTVINVPNSTSVVIDVKYPGSTSSGSTIYADNRKTIFRDLAFAEDLTVYNGARSFGEFIDWTGSSYTTVSSGHTIGAWLSNIPNNFYVTPEQDIWLNMYFDTIGKTELKIVTDQGVLLTGATITISNTDRKVLQFNVGPNNLSPLLNDDIIYYDVYVNEEAGTANPVTTHKRFYLDRRCKIEDYEIAFMDRMGSISSYAFQLRSVESGEIVRDQFKKQVPRIYNTWDRGSQVINVTIVENLLLNTNWMTDEMSVYFKELLSSPYTWVKIDGIYYACIVKDTGFETTRQKNKNLIRRTVNVMMANNNSINI